MKTKLQNKTQKVSRTTKHTEVYLVSEGTGGLARHIAAAAFAQFPNLEPHIESHIFCTSTAKLRDIKSEIERAEAPIVLSALTQPKLKNSLSKWCDRRAISHMDLIGHVVDGVAAITRQRPARDVSRSHRCDDDYFRRMDAWEYTLQHDDSRRLETIDEADIILLGISRVGKTPLSAYLGSMGFRVANVALAPGITVPLEVKANREKTVGLTIHSDRLTEIRKRRFEMNRFKQALHSRGEIPKYCSRQAVLSEVDFAERQFRQLRLPTIDMTDLTVEESAARILQLLSLG